jgi:signal peptidase I
MSQNAPAEPSLIRSRRRPWLAALLSLLWLGVGQLYNGEARKAVALYAVWLALVSTAVLLTILTMPTPVTVAVVLLFGALAVGPFLYGAVDAFCRARRRGTIVSKRYQRVWIYALAIVVSLVVTNVVVRLSAWRPFWIASASMVPTVEPGDYVMTKRYAQHEVPQRGDLATFRHGDFDYFKRVIGVPGDRIQLRAGVVYLNGAPLARAEIAGIFRSDWVDNPAFQYTETLPGGRSYRIAKIAKGDLGAYNNTAEVVVPADHYFVLGEPRPQLPLHTASRHRRARLRHLLVRQARAHRCHARVSRSLCSRASLASPAFKTAYGGGT